MSDISQGPGWWQGSDQRWYPPPPPPTPLANSTKSSHTGLLVLIGVIAVALIAGVVTTVVLLSKKSPQAAPAAAVPTTTTSTSSPAQAADEVRGCMQAHNMQYASAIVQNYFASTPAFLQANPHPYNSSDPIYSGGSPAVTAFESCVWPPIAGADQTGYSQILMTTVPGDTTWPGEVATFAYADVIDATCSDITAQYSGGHTGSSFSETVNVAAGGLVETQPGGTGAFAVAPGQTSGQPLSFVNWAQTLGFFIQPHESAILHAADESVNNAHCGS